MKILHPVARTAFAKTALQQDAVLNKIASLLAGGHPWRLASCRQRQKLIKLLGSIQIHDELLQVLALPRANLSSTGQEFLRSIASEWRRSPLEHWRGAPWPL